MKTNHLLLAIIALAVFGVFMGAKFEYQMGSISQADSGEPSVAKFFRPPNPQDVEHVKLFQPPSIKDPTPHAAEIEKKIRHYKANPPPKVETAKCIHTINRDYTKNPVEFSGYDNNIQCDIPCTRGSLDVGGSGKCPHQKSYERTMENYGNHLGHDNHIAGNTRWESDVHIQYYSWEEYDFMRPIQNKTSKAPVVAMISNCGPQKRLEWIDRLIASGVEIHSMGVCRNNYKTEADNGAGRLEKKVDYVIPKYKFTMSFENSETDDYVTEKMFGPLVAGSIPLYQGAPNGKKYAPNNHSVIFADDFKNPEDMAELLKYLDKNDEAYMEYFSWKNEGPSKDFIALVDSSIVHSNCRFCIRSADIDRKNLGEVVTGPYQTESDKEMEEYKGKVALMIKVRNRGTFWLRRVHIESLTIKELRKKIMDKWNDKKLGEIYGFYKLWDRKREWIKTDQQVAELAYGDELEVVWEYPSNPNRAGYSTWWNEKHRNEFNQSM